MEEFDFKEARNVLPKRNPSSRKGENGRVLVVGGSMEYFGSPALAGLAALRAGADLCYIVCPRFIAPVVAGYSPDLIVWSYGGGYLSKNALPLINKLEEKTDVLLIGNGLTKQPQVLSLIRRIVASWNKAAVIDADAIMAGLEFRKGRTVFTPHPVEFQRLGGAVPKKDPSKRAKQVSSLAGKLGATVLLKGVSDITSDGKRVVVSSTGNAGMTAGGTGDTLAGVCAAFLSQGLEPMDAAPLAAFVNGAAGDRAFKKYGYSLLASDVIDELPAVLKELRARR